MDSDILFPVRNYIFRSENYRVMFSYQRSSLFLFLKRRFYKQGFGNLEIKIQIRLIPFILTFSESLCYGFDEQYVFEIIYFRIKLCICWNIFSSLLHDSGNLRTVKTLKAVTRIYHLEKLTC